MREIAARPKVTLLCGRYEGVDQRVLDAREVEEISLGDFVLSGGEPAAIALIDAVVRLLPGVMGAPEEARRGKFRSGSARISALHPARRLAGPCRAGDSALRPSREDPPLASPQAEDTTRARRPDLWAAIPRPQAEIPRREGRRSDDERCKKSRGAGRRSWPRARKVPEFRPGDTVRVNVKVIEGQRERIQAFEGICIARRNAGLNSSFTVRKISYGEGVERVFPLYQPARGVGGAGAPGRCPPGEALLSPRLARQGRPHQRDASAPATKRPAKLRKAEGRAWPIALLPPRTNYY